MPPDVKQIGLMQKPCREVITTCFLLYFPIKAPNFFDNKIRTHEKDFYTFLFLFEPTQHSTKYEYGAFTPFTLFLLQ